MAHPWGAVQVTAVAVKVMNKDGLPGDSAIGGNGEFCMLFDPETNEPYGYRSGSNGLLDCMLTSVDRPAGKYNVSLVQDGNFGEASIYPTAYLYDVEGRPYSLSFAPRVAAVSPNVGSIAGGTVVTITGHSFSTVESEVDVTVGGVPCSVLSSTLTTIRCKLAARDPASVLPAVQHGSRGIEQKFFDGMAYPGQHDNLATVINDAPFKVTMNEDSFTTPVSWSSTYTSQHRGLFKVPRTATYRFMIASDDNSEVRRIPSVLTGIVALTVRAFGSSMCPSRAMLTTWSALRGFRDTVTISSSPNSVSSAANGIRSSEARSCTSTQSM